MGRVARSHVRWDLVAVVGAAMVLSFGAGWLGRDLYGIVSDHPAAEDHAGHREPDVEQSNGTVEGSTDGRSRGESAAPRRSAADGRPADIAAPGAPEADASGGSLTADAPAVAGRSIAQQPRPRAGRATSANPRTVAEFTTAIEAAWDTTHPNKARPSPPEFEYAAQDGRDRSDADEQRAAAAARSRVTEQVRILSDRMELQSMRGVLDEGPLTIELRARGRESVGGTGLPGKLAEAGFDPLDPGDRETEGVGVLGALPRRGRVLVIERIEIDARLGRSQSREGEIRVHRPGGTWKWPGRSDRLRAVFEGAQDTTDLGLLGLYVSDATARVRFIGRIVAPEDVPEPRPFKWIAEESVGFLRSDVPARLQLVADHGGGNPRTLDLAGTTNSRFDPPTGRPVWDDASDLTKLQGSYCWTENAGFVPPEFSFRVTRIDWRARLLGGMGNSRFEARAQRDKDGVLVNVATSSDVRDGQSNLSAGTWTGDFVIHPGREKDLTFTCYMYGMAEVTVHGRLESR